MIEKKLFERVIGKSHEIINSSLPGHEKLQLICDLLKTSIPHYDWVGFYMTDMKKGNELVLGPYNGDPTDHKRIPFGKGICGQAAETKSTFIVQDVSKENNYLSCSFKVKSEIVVPILAGDKVLGELDIDSHLVGPFDETDSSLLENICQELVEKKIIKGDL